MVNNNPHGIKAGDRVYLVSKSQWIESGEYVVRKVGREFFYFDAGGHELKASVKSLAVDNGFGPSIGQVYTSEQDYKERLGILYDQLKLAMCCGPKPGVTMDDIKQCRKLLRLDGA